MVGDTREDRAVIYGKLWSAGRWEMLGLSNGRSDFVVSVIVNCAVRMVVMVVVCCIGVAYDADWCAGPFVDTAVVMMAVS